MALVQQEAGSHFWPAQVGAAVKGSADKAIHTVRAWTVPGALGDAQRLVEEAKIRIMSLSYCCNRCAAFLFPPEGSTP